MEPIALNEPEKRATLKRIRDYFDKTKVYLSLTSHSMVSIGPRRKIHDLLKPINKEKRKAILETYKATDIQMVIADLANSKLSYDNLREKIVNKEKVEETIISVDYLSQLLPKSELTDLANRILDRIINPLTYYALILLPKVDLTDSIKISETYLLIKANSDIAYNFRTNYPESREYKDVITIKENKTYLLIKQQGCILVGFEKPLSLELIEGKLKIILGLSLAQRIFKTLSNELFSWQREKRKGDIGLFDRIPNEYDEEGNEIGPHEADNFLDDELREYKSGEYRFRYFDKYRLSEDYADLINSLCLSKSAMESLHNLKVVGGGAQRLAKSEESKSPTDILKEKFDALKDILDSDDEYAEAIKTASQWYFEGLCTENETFKFVKYVIAIESLLGDPKEEGRITERLSDRCAYLLADNPKERKTIKKSFKDIYKIRSAIIHRRSTRIQEENSRFLIEARKLTERLIRKEIELYTKMVLS